MNEKLSEVYDAKFYEAYIEGMSQSASIVLGLLYRHFKPQTVIDIGCGQGSWLAAAETLGAKRLKGMDGEWIRKDDLLSKNIDFTAVEFDKSMPELYEKYDLCISLEVAEHISADNAKKFIDLLCQSSDTILFSAAVKHQGGAGHINEQWQSYWIDLFNSNGYKCLDCIRGTIWHNEAVEWWYRQNIFLFVSSNSSLLNLETLRTLEKPIDDIVHPVHYEDKIKFYKNQINYPTLQFCFDCIKRYIKNGMCGFIKKY